MKFDLPEKEIKLIDGKLVQLPAKRFIGLMDYVEDLEAKLLAARIEVREGMRVGQQMESLIDGKDAQEEISSAEFERIQKIVEAFTDPEKLKAAGEKQGISIRRLAMMTAIPYATLYRYLHQTTSLDMKTAATIMRALNAGQVQGYPEKAKL